MPCSKRLHFEASVVATAVLFAAAGLTVAGLLGLVAAAIPPFGLHLVLFGGAMVVDVMFGLWLCVLCQICQIHWYVEEWFFQLAMWQKILSFSKILFLTSLTLYKGINKCMGRLYFCDFLFPKIDLSWSTFFVYHILQNQISKGRSSLGWHQSSVSKIWTKVKVIRCYEQWNWYHLYWFFSQKGFADGTPITKGVRCVVNNESLLHTTHIILIINLVMANKHPKLQSTKRLVVGLSGEKMEIQKR